MFWSTRGVTEATIYRLDTQGNRTIAYNVGPDGRTTVPTNRRDRISADFLLAVGEGTERVEQRLSVPLACPVAWFFNPAPEACPNDPAEETFIIEQPFERGLMIYLGVTDRIYVFFNDGQTPAWASYENSYDPAIHPEFEPNFIPPAGFVQPLGRLGFLWRGRDSVRNRLGLGLTPEVTYEGFLQTAPQDDGTGDSSLFISASNDTVLQLLPRGTSWQIITPS